MQGIVRWYSAKGFGFIDPSGSADNNAIYFHLSDVKGRIILRPGDGVVFDVVQVPKGPKCVNVRAVVSDTKEETQCPQSRTA